MSNIVNQSNVLNYIKMRLGVPFQALELTDEDIINIINMSTLPTYSKYYPYFHVIKVDPSEHKVEGREGMYYIDTPLHIIGVSKLLTNNNAIHGGLGDPLHYRGIVDRKIYNDLTSMVMQPETFKFHTPNIVEVFPKNIQPRKFAIEIKTVHPEHLATIPINMKDEFEKLAYCDVMIALFPIRQRFMNINSTFGNIELFMHDFDRAVEMREDILDRWRSNYGKNSKRRKIYVY